MLRNERVLALVEGLNGDYAGLKSPGIFHLDVIELYTGSTEEPPISITVENAFVNNPYKPEPFHAPTFYTSLKAFPRNWGLCL